MRCWASRSRLPGQRLFDSFTSLERETKLREIKGKLPGVMVDIFNPTLRSQRQGDLSVL